MPDGGNLEIKTGFVRDTEAGDAVTLDVVDDGKGMDRDTVQRAFEPFYSTKESGRGSGLGLAAAYTIINQNGGTISIDSEVSKGTSIRVTLPAAE